MNKELPINLLRTFWAVSETGSFTRAGEILHLTQSAVSMQMKRLEEVVGQPLFQKNGRTIHLNATAEILLEHAFRILTAHDEALAAFSSPSLNGRVSFGCAEDYTTRFLPIVLAGFRRTYPHIRVDIQSASSHELHELIRRKKLDLCLLDGIADGGRVVYREQVVWAASVRGVAHEMSPLPLAVYKEGCIYRKWALEALRKQGIAYWLAFVSSSISSILAAVRSGLAVAPIGTSTLDESLRVLGPEAGFPLLPVSEVSLLQSSAAENEPVNCFADYVIASFSKIINN